MLVVAKIAFLTKIGNEGPLSLSAALLSPKNISTHRNSSKLEAMNREGRFTLNL